MGNIKSTFINQETIISVSICISPSIHSMIYKEKQWVSQVNFFKLSFGDEFDCNGTIWIHLDLFHVLETQISIQRNQDDVLERILSAIQYDLNSVYMTLVWSFNPQVEALLIHLSHELHDTNKSLENLKL